MLNKKLYDCLEALDYTDFVQVSRGILCQINSSFYDERDIDGELMKIARDCFDMLDVKEDEQELISYIQCRVNRENEKIEIKDEKLKALISEFGISI